MTLKLGSNSTPSDLSKLGGVEQSTTGGRMVTSVLTLAAIDVPRLGAGWLGKGLLQLGGSFLGPSGGEVERLRDLVQCARVLMRDEDTKRQSLSLQRHRLSFQQADVAVTP